MRVGIDATPLTVPTGGIRRYVVELTRSLANLFPENQYHLLTDQVGWELPSRLAGLPNVVAQVERPTGLRAKWWGVGLPWEVVRRRIDVFHGANFSIPYLPVRPSVLVIHDLSPWKTGDLRPAGSDRVRLRTPRIVHLASRIITPTEAIRREVSDFFRIPGARVRVTPLAAADSIGFAAEPSGTAALSREFGLGVPYLMFLGTGQQRKNLAGLIEAWRRARAARPDLSLVIVGSVTGSEPTPSRQPGLHWFGHLPDKELAGLLSGAAAFVYPSYYEGFGLPVLEAMQAGAPVITSKDPAITEVTAGAALQVDVSSESELCAAILTVVNHPEIQERLKVRGRQRASHFSWRSTALLTHAVYVEAIRGF